MSKIVKSKVEYMIVVGINPTTRHRGWLVFPVPNLH
jgi:hypothetical protein